MKHSSGFTVIELIVVIAFVGLATFLLLTQKEAIDAGQRDSLRKVAINAMYYNLEEVFYQKNGYYPIKIESSSLKAVDPDLLIDPNGTTIGSADSDYRYDSMNCSENKCQSYTLKALLEKEADYVKKSRRR